ncbi:energy transducer TonB [Desulfatitalea tepidiphila]|uniref:energy transducer TonB n=1 Tax=Desulfatitalea tepidiphila TaxID=1185843 RepID=UPI0006B4C6D2|nr:energy transducer TonB [Desulfatitalea tepidiphila]
MKRWIVPVLMALACHAVFFKLDLVATPPVMAMHENRTITISLVQVPAPAAPKPVRPLPVDAPDPIAPMAPLVPKKAPPVKPEPLPRPEPAPMAVPTPEPAASQVSQTQPTPVEPAAGASSPENASPSAEAQMPGPDQAEVQASVPLYHLNPPPVYPAVARRRNYQGTVRLDVLVDRQGRAAQVRLAESCGYAMLDRSAVKSVGLWRFEPARRFGRPIEMWVRVPVRFELR